MFCPRFLRVAISSLLMALSAYPAAAASDPVVLEQAKPEPLRIVYHIGDGIDQAARTIANIRNQLRISPDIRIVVVAIGPGIDFLLDGAKDKNGNPFDASVEDLARQSVGFRICGTTIDSRHIALDMILPDAQVVPSGMNEIARLELRDGYAYIRP